MGGAAHRLDLAWPEGCGGDLTINLHLNTQPQPIARRQSTGYQTKRPRIEQSEYDTRDWLKAWQRRVWQDIGCEKLAPGLAIPAEIICQANS